MTKHPFKSNFFEDFRLGQIIHHATPRTVSDGDISAYLALTGSRFAIHCADTVARELGHPQRPLEDLLVFNIAFGKTVPDLSVNAVANLGYADLRFLAPVYAGDTLSCESVVIGLKENSSRLTGVVYVRSTCYNKDGVVVLTWVRWVMVHKRRREAKVADPFVPELLTSVPKDDLTARARIRSSEALEEWCEASGSAQLWDAYAPGDRIDHPLGMTMEHADNMAAARLYQNNSRPHFDGFGMRQSQIGQRLVYGGHVISVCRALSHDGLENAVEILAVNAGTHVSPTLAGDTLYAFTEVLDRFKLPNRTDVGALRLRLVGLKDTIPADVEVASTSMPNGGSAYHPAVVLDLDYVVAVPRKAQGSNRHD